MPNVLVNRGTPPSLFQLFFFFARVHRRSSEIFGLNRLIHIPDPVSFSAARASNVQTFIQGEGGLCLELAVPKPV